MTLCSQAVLLTAVGLFLGLGPGIIELFMHLQMYIIIQWDLQKCPSKLDT